MKDEKEKEKDTEQEKDFWKFCQECEAEYWEPYDCFCDRDKKEIEKGSRTRSREKWPH
jgi:hypothetical protein